MVAGVAAAAAAALLWLPLHDTAPTDEDVRAALVSMLEQAAPKEQLEQRIASALDRDAPEEAEDYLDVADFLRVPIDPALRSRFADETSGLRAAERTVRRAATGFVTGEGEGAAGMAAAIASDLTVVGDIRDLTEQASRIVRGEPVDDLVLGLSIAGVAMSAATMATAGGALPVKTGVSLAKLARRTGALTARFQQELSRVVVRAADTPAFRQSVAGIPWYRVDDLARAARSHAARVDMGELRHVLGSVAEVGRATSPSRTLAILRHVDDVKDLRDAERAAKLLGKPVSGAFRLAGKRVFSVMAHAWKMGAKLILALVAAVISALSFLVCAVMKLKAALRLWRALRPAASAPVS